MNLAAAATRFLAPHLSSRSRRYGLALTIVCVAVLIDFGLAYLSFSANSYMLLSCAVLAAAALAGTGPSLMVATIATIFNLVIIGQDWSDPDERLYFGLFLVTTIATVSLARRLDTWRLHARSHELKSARIAEELGILIDGATGLSIYMLDPSGRVVHWNRGAERMQGWTEEEVAGGDHSMFYTQADVLAGKPLKDLKQAVEHGYYQEEVACIRKDGSSFVARGALTLLEDNAGRVRGFARVLRDVTLEREQELAIEAREALFRSVLEIVPYALFVARQEGCLLYVNPTAEVMFDCSRSTLLGGNLFTLIPDLAEVLGSQGKSRASPQLLSAVRPDGFRFPVEVVVGEALSEGRRLLTAYVRDLTEQQALQAQIESLQMEVLHGSRRSAMGTMASTLAHEINQPITAIANYVEGCRTLLTRGTPEALLRADDVLGSAASEAIRVGGIVGRLRNFVNHGETMLAIQDLQTVLEGALVLTQRSAGLAGVRIELNVDPDTGPVLADVIQIQQVINNICRNAIEAMRSTPVRRLVISAAPINERTVHIVVEDTGPGFKAEIANRLFDAFVTSKAEGLGVGLSICRTIIEAHGGRIWATSDPLGGAAFHFTLPRPLEKVQ